MIEIWGGDTPGWVPEYGQGVPALDPYLVELEQPGSVFIVCPGGAYMHKAKHEGRDVARWLNTIGISAFVLDYRIAPYRHPAPLSDAQRAIQFVRANAARYNIDPNRIGIMGFSAGGHLAASAAIYPLAADPAADDTVARAGSEPNCLVLGYPVISMERFHHKGSRDNLLGPDPDPALVDQMALEKHVHGQMPPAFIWHTADDQAVPVENSLMFASALSRARVSFALHILPRGRHGLGLAPQQPEVAVWTDLLTQWLRQIGF